MNNLKKYAGLLNEVAPEGEFLAYINNDEEKMLRKAGGNNDKPSKIPNFGSIASTVA